MNDELSATAPENQDQISIYNNPREYKKSSHAILLFDDGRRSISERDDGRDPQYYCLYERVESKEVVYVVSIEAVVPCTRSAS
jgi:hypothetical protein